VPLEEFCARFFDALCAPLDACDCGLEAMRECRAEEDVICRSFPSPALRAAVADGSVAYDPEAGSELLRRLRERGCDGFVTTLDWQVRDLFDLGGTFGGGLPAGAECTMLGFELTSQCTLGSCAPTPDGNVCRASVDEGQRCDRTHQCVDLDATLITGGAVDRLALRCDPDAPTSETGTCRRWVLAGSACVEDGECWTGHCEAERCVERALGDDCISSRECADGLYCTSLRCTEGGAADGASCDDDAACSSLVCVAGVCRPVGCDTF